MTVREISLVPDEVLRRKAHPVKKFDDTLQALIDDMVDTMRDAPGVGLAAPQVGISERVIVVEYAEPKEVKDSEEPEVVEPKLYVLVNPEIKRKSQETILGIEGCLSVPNLVGEVDRSLSVTVKGQNRYGQPLRIKAGGWLARIFQHEIDHLDGILYTDRAEQVWVPEEPVEDKV
ncbi:MAG: peptide deformylase [Anaerolineales bacterium]|nr:peptide deformylase [Anaerolineales bacterium]